MEHQEEWLNGRYQNNDLHQSAIANAAALAAAQTIETLCETINQIKEEDDESSGE